MAIESRPVGPGILRQHGGPKRHLVLDSADYTVASPTLTFSSWLYDMMQQVRLSQRRVGLVSRVNHSSISRLLRGERDPRTDTFAVLVNAFGLSEGEIFDAVTRFVPQERRMTANRSRIVFSPDAPVLSGSMGEQLRGYRIVRGLSERGAGNRSGVDHSLLSKWETGDRIPQLRNYVRIVFEYGLNSRQNAALLVAAEREQALLAPLSTA